MRKDFLELTYKLRLRKIFISVLSLLILSFYILPRIAESDIMFEAIEQTEVIIVEIPETQIQQQQFKSARPSIPIEADEDSDIDTLDLWIQILKALVIGELFHLHQNQIQDQNGFNMTKLQHQKKHSNQNILIFVGRQELKVLW